MVEVDRPIMIVAGGTGGHIYPALAVAEYFRSRNIRTVWLGSREGLETRIVPEAGIELFRIAVSGLRGRGLWRWIVSPFVLIYAVSQAFFTVCRVRPQLILGMGGFASGPGGVAAWLCRKPLVIHEQNAIPGLTNQVLSRIATKVLEGFPGAFPESRNAIAVGNPVRRNLHEVIAPRKRALDTDPFKILVVGGSRGARALNEALPQALALANLDKVEILHQAGSGNAAETKARYRDLSINSEVAEFIDDMAAAYAWASVVICRAGALTVCELAAVGAASILVPFPFAVDDHQSANAQFLVSADAATLVAEGPHFSERLAESITHLYNHRDEILSQAEAARSLAVPDAGEHVANYCLELLDG